MADSTTQTYVTREPEWMEAYRRAMLEDIRDMVKRPVDVAEYRVAGMSPQQLQAIRMAQQGIGAYMPYLSQASSLYGSAAGDYGRMGQYGARAVQDIMAGRSAAQPYISEAGGSYRGMEAGAQQGAATAGRYGRQAISSADPYLNRAASSYNAMRGLGREGADLAESYAGTAAMRGMQGARAYDPRSVTDYMNPFQQEVTQQTLAEMNRQAAIQQQGVASQAAKAGAFGGSRFGVQQAELGRNQAQAQGQVISQQYAQNYSQAQQAAMDAFQNQQARMQQAGQLALGAGSLASTGQFQGAQTEGQAAQGFANIGQQRSQTALQAGQLESGAQLSAASMMGQAGQGLANLGQQQFGMGQAIGQADISAGQLYGQQAAGLAGLGTSQANLGQMRSALSQGDTSFMYNIGSNLQAQQQKILEAQRLNQQLYNMEPYQRMSYYSDILNRTPSGQMGYSQSTAPSPSLFSQFAGLGIAGLGAYNAYNNPYYGYGQR